MSRITHIATSARNPSTGAWERIDLTPLGPHDSTDLSQVELNPTDFGGQAGATYLVELLDADGTALDSIEVVAVGPLIDLDALATELDVTRETIDVLAGQLADDPDLYDADAGMLTPAGAELVRDQIASGAGVELALADCAGGQSDYERARDARPGLVRQARDLGATWQQIADAMRLSSREAARAIAASER